MLFLIRGTALRGTKPHDTASHCGAVPCLRSFSTSIVRGLQTPFPCGGMALHHHMALHDMALVRRVNGSAVPPGVAQGSPVQCIVVQLLAPHNALSCSCTGEGRGGCPSERSGTSRPSSAP